MTDLFLSYRRDERAQVERLANALRGLGLDVWFDARLSAGESFSDEIDREVRAARVIAVCWSPAAAASQWVKAEAQIGFSKQNLVSLYVSGSDGFEPPVPFNGVHIEDLRRWVQRPSSRDKAWLSTLRRVGALTDRADLAEWGALGASATVAQIESWLTTHGSTSPLVVDAESFLRERNAAEGQRVAAELAARERVDRLRAEKAAAERTASEARKRAEAEMRAREADRRAAEVESRVALDRRASLSVAAVTIVAAAFLTWYGLTNPASSVSVASLIIGWLVGAAIGALLILLGSRVVMGKTATFVSAFLAGLASAVVGFVAGFIIGFAVSAAAPALAPQVQILGAVAGFVITGPIYAAIIRTADGSKPSMLQAYLIYIIQIAIAVAVIFALVTVFHIAVPGMPMLGGQAG